MKHPQVPEASRLLQKDLTFPRGTDVTNASAFPPPTPVSEAELVASNARNPASIKPEEPQAHQQNWGALGGRGRLIVIQTAMCTSAQIVRSCNQQREPEYHQYGLTNQARLRQ